MAKQSDSAAPQNATSDTVIGEGMRLVGSIEFGANLLVRGVISGSVFCPPEHAGRVVIDASGCITGRVSAPHIVLKGRIEGPINATQLLEVQSTGRCDGDVAYERLDIHSGGIINGSLASLSAHGVSAPASGVQAKAGRTAVATPDADALVKTSAQKSTGAPKRIGLWAIAASLIVAGWISLKMRQPSSPNEVVASTDQAPAAPATSAPSSTDRVLPQKTDSAPAAASPDRTESAAQHTPAPSVKPSPQPAPPSPISPAAPVIPVSSAPDTPATNGDERAEPDTRKILAIPGANPAKSAGTLYLVVNEPAVFYKKRRDDPSPGTRLEVSQSKTLSVPISRNELFRVARGSAVEIFYQGRKVGQSTINGGGWMSFTPVAADE